MEGGRGFASINETIHFLMKKISSEDLKSIQTNILNEIHEICIEIGIKYTLAYGTLIGAVRHGGFIPWDDDIDLLMFAEDFDKLVGYYRDHSTKFRIAHYDTMGSRYRKLHAKVYDPNTTIDEHNSKTSGIGVNIDILILHNIGNSEQEAVRNFNRIRFGIESIIASNWNKYEINHSKSVVYNCAKLFFYVMGKIIPYSFLYERTIKRLRSFGDHTKYVISLGSPYRTIDIHDRKMFENLTKISFENNSYYAIEAYDSFLGKLYGDYMKLPSEEKRVTHHDFIPYYK